jgi:adenine-specific DNA-methyltransferase
MQTSALGAGPVACFVPRLKGRNGASIVNPTSPSQFPTQLLNRLHHANCIAWMKNLPDGCVDFGLTDPPYMVRYRDRDGRSIPNDDNSAWLVPAFREIFRVLRPDRFLICFYGWHAADTLLNVWRSAGFYAVGHFVFPKSYASSRRFTAAQHEQAYLLAKGQPAVPSHPISDVLPWRYTGNRWHPCQKPLCALLPLIDAFSSAGEVVLDPFAGSASTLIAASHRGRRYCGVELDDHYYSLAQQHLTQMTSIGRASAA